MQAFRILEPQKAELREVPVRELSPFRPRLRLPSVKAAWWPQRHRTRVERGTGNERLGSAMYG